MKLSRFDTLKAKNSIIFIIVMVPLFTIFLSYEVTKISDTLKKTLMERGVIYAQTGATTMSKILGDAVKNGHFTEEQIFDTDYRPIPGTTPKKYNTEYDTYMDENIRGIEDSFLEDPVVVYAVAVDINGYLPTHNTKFSQPGGGLLLDRSKRIFEDEVGIKAARNKEKYLLQEYYRDTGEIMWDISSPIYVNGRHWGAFRIGFSMEETYNQIYAAAGRMLISGLTLTVALIILAVYISNRISNRVKVLVEEANRVATGDLSLTGMIFDTGDEVAALGRSFVNMVSKLRELTEKTQYSASLVGSYLNDLLKNTEHVTESANSVASKMDLVSGAIDNMEQNTGRISETSEKVAEELSEAKASSKRFLENMEESKKAMSVAHNVVKDLEFQVDKVGQFIQVVSILAEQAGLMSRKIVQEASHFCTEGNEMAALAMEVQSNAEDAAKTTEDVSELFRTVRDYASQASKTLEGHQSVILEGIKAAKLSGRSLGIIVSELKNLSDLTSELVNYSKELVDGVKSINTDVEVQARLVKQFTEATGTLEQIVDELKGTLDNIKV
ncbi:MAG: hypothetical protein CVU89_08695 [Firmicutes bacterium HGW-Firmicutes-14]|nr:MAG: hypothetical protein CVU89_08695 [Firmicutes bacterium HGW-Firmicutes-14]